ncbi:unnamed protein product [Orchesella dallaii]|uniref:Uncharacterized protein n=1 Tax=Orchesella dallaii TaxID=48710 RepID=A0ABP1RVG3_9HEXA
MANFDLSFLLFSHSSTEDREEQASTSARVHAPDNQIVDYSRGEPTFSSPSSSLSDDESLADAVALPRAAVTPAAPVRTPLQTPMVNQVALEGAGLWGNVDGSVRCPTSGNDEISKWKVADAKVKAPTLGERQLAYIHQCTTSKEVFDKVKQVYDDSLQLNCKATINAFFMAVFGENESAVDGYMKIASLSRSLKNMGQAIADTMLIARIVSE